MPDKDFDNLFRDKFKDAEIEPSANLWAKIETQLEPKRKRILPIYWMAAASVAVAFTAILVFQKTEKIQLKLDNTTAKITSAVAQTDAHNLTDETIAIPVQDKVLVKTVVASTKVNKTNVKKVQAVVETISKNNDESLQPSEAIARLLIKPVDEKVENPIVIAQANPQQKPENNVMDVTTYPSESLSEDKRESRRGLFAFVGRVKDKIDKTTKNIITERDGIVSIDLGLVTLQKDIN